MKKVGNTEQIDFSVLGNMEIPEIAQGGTVKLKPVSKEDADDIKEDIIGEVDSLESFNAGDSKETPAEAEPETEVSSLNTPEDIEPPVEDTEEPSNEEVSVIKGLAEWSKEQGILEYDPEKFEDSEDWLKSAFSEKVQKEVYSEVQKYKEELPGVIKDILNNYEEGVPLDEMIYSKSREIEYNGITESQLEESEEIQKRLVADWYANQDYDQDEIESKITKLKDAVLLEDEAKTALKKLKVFEARYQQELVQAVERNRKAEEKAFAERLANLEKEVMSSEEIIPGIKVTPEERKKIFEAYTKPDSKRDTALVKALRNDPKAWLKITQFMVLMNGDFESVKKNFKTEATKKVKETVNTYQEPKGTLSKININKVKKAIELSKRKTI